MLLDEDRVTEAALFQRQRCAAFGATTAARICAAENCQFSFLPHKELARMASGWYAGSAQAMLNGNYAPIDSWIKVQSQSAASENFDLEDLLVLLQICRTQAIREEKWSEDIFSVVDDAINEALRSIRGEVSWDITANFDYMSSNHGQPQPAASVQQRAEREPAKPGAAVPARREEPSGPWSGNWRDNRRDFGRNSLRLPLRVRSDEKGFVEEITHSANVSRSGLYFVTQRSSYKLLMALRVTYPYWTEPGSITKEYRAKVVRLDRLRGDSVGVAVEFTESLGPRLD